MNNSNEMVVEFKSIGQNEGFARMVVAAFVSSTNPTLEELSDIKTAVSEAVTNSIIHGYENTDGMIRIKTVVDDRKIYIEIIDKGQGIKDVARAMEPMFTTKPEQDRSGMGFSFMEAFMDKLQVESAVGEGTVIKMWKEIGVVRY